MQPLQSNATLGRLAFLEVLEDAGSGPGPLARASEPSHERPVQERD